jgi:hypothetical protein
MVFVPESLNEACTKSWQLTETEGRTSLSFQDLQLELPSQATAQVKHCRIAWKPLIPAGCYAPSARLKILGRLQLDSDSPDTVRAQLRMSHDLLGQGVSSPFKSMEVKEGPFQVTLELPPERFQQRWDQVKLVSHLSLYLRQIKQESDSNTNRNSTARGRFAIDSLELESLRSQECPPMQARRYRR